MYVLCGSCINKIKVKVDDSVDGESDISDCLGATGVVQNTSFHWLWDLMVSVKINIPFCQ